jgi:hypothetical protein
MKSLYESLMDVDNNIDSFDEELVAQWCTKHESSSRKTVNSSDIKKNGDKFDILPSQPIILKAFEPIPFKIGKLNGCLNMHGFELTGDHIIDECGGISFDYMKGGKKLKNLTIRINSDLQIPNSSFNGLSFWKSAGFLSNVKNITFDFTNAPSSRFDIDVFKKNTPRNINLIDCPMILSNDEAKATLDDIKDIKGVSKIYSNSGRTEEFSFYYDGKKWNQGRK